jgi:hypothetical protein
MRNKENKKLTSHTPLPKVLFLLMTLMSTFNFSMSEKKKKNLLYISNKKYKSLYNEGSTLSLFLGIDSDKLFSENKQTFSYDFMFDEIIYNTYGNYECTTQSMCEYHDDSKQFNKHNIRIRKLLDLLQRRLLVQQNVPLCGDVFHPSWSIGKHQRCPDLSL